MNSLDLEEVFTYLSLKEIEESGNHGVNGDAKQIREVTDMLAGMLGNYLSRFEYPEKSEYPSVMNGFGTKLYQE